MQFNDSSASHRSSPLRNPIAPHSRPPTPQRLRSAAMGIFTAGLLSLLPSLQAAVPRVPVIVYAGGFSPTLDSDERGGIYLADQHGGFIKQLTVFSRINREVSAEHGLNLPDDHPNISPDGKRIAFTSNRADRNNWDLYVMNLNGTGVTRLTFAEGMDTEPSWSADGSQLVFVTERFGSHDLALLQVSTRELKRLTFDTQNDELEPSFSPDGTLIAYSRVRSGNDKDIFLIRPDGTGNRQITFSPGEDHDATWSPDGRQLVITSERFGTTPYGDVTIIGTNGAVVRRIPTTTHGGGDPAWSPDGTRIAFFHSEPPLFNTKGPQQIATIGTNGTSLVEFRKTDLVCVHPNWGLVPDSDGDGRADLFETSNVVLNEERFGLDQGAGIDGVQFDDFFGVANAVADLDRNGIPELLIGSYRDAQDGLFGPRLLDVGAVFACSVGAGQLLHGFPIRLANGTVLDPQGFQCDIFGATPLERGYFGHAIVSGDFDKDGFREAAIGAPGMNDVFILGGRATQINRLSGGESYGAVLAVGDFNRDGRQDLVVGAPMNVNGQGSVHVHFGTANGVTQLNVPLSQASFGFPRPAQGRFGSAITTGNVLGDDADDLIVGAFGTPSGTNLNAGAVFVIPGKVGAPGSIASFQTNKVLMLTAFGLPIATGGIQSGARFGEVLATGRFKSGSTHAALIVGTPLQDLEGKVDAGMVLLYPGGQEQLAAPILLKQTQITTSSTTQATAEFGKSIVTADVTGDKVADLVVSTQKIGDAGNEAVIIIPGTVNAGTPSKAAAVINPISITNLTQLGLVSASAQTLLPSQFDVTTVALRGFGASVRRFHKASSQMTRDLDVSAPHVLAAADLDLDGQSDLLLGMPASFSGGMNQAGELVIRFGGQVGVITTPQSHTEAAPNEWFNYEVTWTHPQNWNLLQTIDLKFSTFFGTAAWIRFHQETEILDFYDVEQDRFIPGGKAGQWMTLSNGFAALDLRQTSLTSSGEEGRTVTLKLALRFGHALTCNPLQIEMMATDDLGQSQGWDPAGTLDLGPCAPILSEGHLILRFPTQSGFLHQLQSAPALSGPWQDVESITGDGNILTRTITLSSTNQFYRLIQP